ncbi:MAG: alpha/beta hydrolase [Actinomycetota bacterium]|nr:alpha/beta hydrolase [Actinomycetota bacterium]
MRLRKVPGPAALRPAPDARVVEAELSQEHRVVLLHGQPGSVEDWVGVAAALPAGITSYALDRPGYGDNVLAAGGFEHNARAVLAEMDRQGIERTIVCGHSYGGGVAVAMARLAPERVSSLLLVSSVAPDGLNGWDWVLAAPVLGWVCAVAAFLVTPPVVRAGLRRIERRRGSPLLGHEHVYWHAWGHSRHDHGRIWRTFLAEQRLLRGELEELRRSLDGITTPTVVLADRADTIMPLWTAERLAAAIPNAALVIEEGGAGHHLPRRNPRAVATEIVALASRSEQPVG